MSNKPIHLSFDKKALEALWKNSYYFIEVLGEPKVERNELSFPLKNLPFSEFKIRYDLEKKFLGRIYVMVLVAKILKGNRLDFKGRIELRYSGFFKKGEAFFISVPSVKDNNSEREILQLLNSDYHLIKQCSKLEIEFLRMLFDSQEERWKVEIRPYGGSFIEMMFPPMSYNVVLVEEQAELILSIIKNIGHLIGGCP